MSSFRRNSKSGFYIDIEKTPIEPIEEEDEEQEVYYQNKESLLSIVLLILSIGTLFNLILFKSCSSAVQSANQSYIKNFFKFCFDMQEDAEEEVVFPEGAVMQEEEEEVDAQADLKEMLSIAPITLLLNEETPPEKQGRFLQILLYSFSIIPEPVTVELHRHPHYYQVYQYLKSYTQHEQTTTTTTSTIKDAQYSTDTYREDEDHIPRLFIGGTPVGDYDCIIKLYDEGKLVDFLREKGDGLINVG
ncbi:hypothetical protein QCA50_017092 [Cerrena zonata]|uniref:Glutaredoxin domain-containing protein n=1 Tax=Cerrena zonata TaxID=2478898 RepID=A0AAW0FRL7_9APHY